MALAREVAHHAFRVGPFGDVFDHRDLHRVAERTLHLAAAEVVLIGPAGLADRRHVDERDFERGGGRLGVARGDQRRHR